MPSRRKSRTVAAVSMPTSSCASSVDAAMCGVAITCGSLASDQSDGGSFSNTSSAAPATMPRLDRAAERRLVDQLAARRVDRCRMPGLHLANRSSSKMCSGLRRRRQMQRQIVGGGAHLVERHQLDADAVGDLARDVTDRGRRRACRRRARAAPLPGRFGPGRRRPASCRAARCRETAFSPSAVLHRAIRGRHRARQRRASARRRARRR